MEMFYMVDHISDIFRSLYEKNNRIAYQALQILQKESMESDAVYFYMNQMGDMLKSENSYIRTRGLTLIAYNAKWDSKNNVDAIIDEYLKHITDSKPITARQCIQLLPMIAKGKPELRADIVDALERADISIYANSMQPLVHRDIHDALMKIRDL